MIKKPLITQDSSDYCTVRFMPCRVLTWEHLVAHYFLQQTHIDKHSSLLGCQSLYYVFDVRARQYSRRTLCARSGVDWHYWHYYTQNYYLDFLRGKGKRERAGVFVCFLPKYKSVGATVVSLHMSLNTFRDIWQDMWRSRSTRLRKILCRLGHHETRPPYALFKWLQGTHIWSISWSTGIDTYTHSPIRNMSWKDSDAMCSTRSRKIQDNSLESHER